MVIGRIPWNLYASLQRQAAKRGFQNRIFELRAHLEPAPVYMVDVKGKSGSEYMDQLLQWADSPGDTKMKYGADEEAAELLEWLRSNPHKVMTRDEVRAVWSPEVAALVFDPDGHVRQPETD